jgi:hypothetical protein
MKIASLITALIATAAFTALGQDGVVQDVKHGAKKAGETIKDGILSCPPRRIRPVAN